MRNGDPFNAYVKESIVGTLLQNEVSILAFQLS